MHSKFIVWQIGKFTMFDTGSLVLSVLLRRVVICWAHLDILSLVDSKSHEAKS